MEAVHKTYRRPWISSILNLRNFLDDTSSAVGMKFNINEELLCDNEERMLRFYGGKDELEKAAKGCSKSLLDCEGEDFIEFCRQFDDPENNELETLKRQSEEMKKRNGSSVYRNMVFQCCRYKYYSSSMEVVPVKKKHAQAQEFLSVEHPEIILTVQIYRPETQQLLHQRTTPSRTPTFCVDQQFLVLGRQCLTEVRDLICCQSDSAVVGEFSENPSASSGCYASQDIYGTGFFYISGTFYNDTRDPLNKDYSKSIIEWSETARDIGPFSSAKMEETRFIDLEIQLGLPYLYMHQGHCEHMLVFSELKLMTSQYPQNLLDYPLTQILQPKKPVHCMSCLMYTAKWIITEDKRMAEIPYFFCDKCFRAFNYDMKGNKIADFKAYKYFDRTAIF